MKNSEFKDDDRRHSFNLRARNNNNQPRQINTDNNQENNNINSGNKDVISGIKNESTMNDIMDDNIFEGDLQLTLEERKAKLQEIEESASKLVLEVVNKVNLPLGAKIQISAVGIESSMRNEKDGLVYFGCLNKESNDKDVSILILIFQYKAN